MSTPLAPSISVSYIGDEIGEAIHRLRQRRQQLGPFDLDARLAIDLAIKKLEDTSLQLSEGLCGRTWIISR